MTVLKWTAIVIAVGAILLLLAGIFFSLVVNPAVMEELRTNPGGEEAQRAMLITYKNRTLPVNYLKEGSAVYMAIDGRWWREFREEMPVTMLIKGETYRGTGIVVLDDPGYVKDVFSRLRPTAPEWLPAWLNGRLVVITLETDSDSESR